MNVKRGLVGVFSLKFTLSAFSNNHIKRPHLLWGAVKLDHRAANRKTFLKKNLVGEVSSHFLKARSWTEEQICTICFPEDRMNKSYCTRINFYFTGRSVTELERDIQFLFLILFFPVVSEKERIYLEGHTQAQTCHFSPSCHFGSVYIKLDYLNFIFSIFFILHVF